MLNRNTRTSEIGLAIAFLALIFAVSAAAPASAKDRIGVYAGPSVANQSFNDPEFRSEPLTGLSIGTFFDGSIGRQAAIQFRGGYVEKGFSTSSGEVTGDLKLQYIESATYLKLLMGRGGAQPYIYAGPNVSYRMSAEIIANGYGETATLDVTDETNSTEFGFDFGLGLHAQAVLLEFRYSLGLSDVLLDSRETAKNRSFQILAGFAFSG